MYPLASNLPLPRSSIRAAFGSILCTPPDDVHAAADVVCARRVQQGRVQGGEDAHLRDGKATEHEPGRGEGAQDQAKIIKY